ncbi:MAG: hypothetical protein IPL41_05165 [Micropruina sp.]|nr:hypothetical protein [Micropruina sp.]
MTDFDPTMPDESEQLDQLQPDETLIDRGVADVLDEGYIAPEKWSPAQSYGNTAAEMRHGETIEQRLAQEEPDVAPVTEQWNDDGDESRQVGKRRAGRLVDADGGYGDLDIEPESIGYEVGISGGAASAEEAAMHVIDDYEDDDDDN